MGFSSCEEDTPIVGKSLASKDPSQKSMVLMSLIFREDEKITIADTQGKVFPPEWSITKVEKIV